MNEKMDDNETRSITNGRRPIRKNERLVTRKLAGSRAQ
jgi:hypothetical protein